MKSSAKLLSTVFLTIIFHHLHAQECTTSITIKLKNISGGTYANQKVTLTGKADGKTFTAKSDSKGEAVFNVPCNNLFDIVITNYTRKKEILSGDHAGGMVMRTFSYEPDMAAKEKAFEMTADEKLALDNQINMLPDSVVMKNSEMEKPVNTNDFSQMIITIVDIENRPLAGEQLHIIGEKRNKKIIGLTDSKGRMVVYLPKGDDYWVNFKYNKNFIKTSINYSKGVAQAEMNFSYLGTKEIEKRKKTEAARIALEEKRLKDEADAFAKKCKKLGISIEEGRKREMTEHVFGGGKSDDTVVTAVLNRNKWTEKLIVCDLTGSMMPYAAQLATWYQMCYLKETNLQFVFFNDGDSKPDSKKKIGDTGGIYYSPSKGIDSLFKTVLKVTTAGGGGDCPENNMEALIKGVKVAKPYKELVMIADNNAPVKDIELLKKFNAPVHIIMCGVNDFILADYLTIAWKTKGSVHTMEEDITKLASMLEGQEILIGKKLYKIMGGEFVQITKA